jgi:DNA-binding GntR family transcriptional regulator
MTKEINPGSLEERVYAILEEEILSGKLKRGVQLRESALAERLNASRTPVRGALHRLAEDGLVELYANRGATVVGISEEDIEDIYDIRIRLEGLAARLAAERMGEEEMNELKASVELSEFYLSRGSDERYGELDSEFHRIIFHTCGSRMLCKILSELHTKIKVYRKFSLSNVTRAKNSVEEHRQILNAIIAKDADKAEELTVLHLSEALKNFKQKSN